MVIIAGIVVATRRPAPPPPTPAAAPAPPPVDPTAPVKPRLPPGPNGKKPVHAPEPQPPQPSDAWKAELQKRVAGSAHPGETAFRAYSDLYVDQNLSFAEKQAAQEGLTVREVRDLTHFGLLVLATQRVPEVEEVLGRELSDDERDALAALMQSSNTRFKEAMRALVARGASEAERDKLIRDTDAEYRKGLFAATGMTADQLDDLLAGNLLLPGAPGAAEAPSGAPVTDGKDEDPTPPERPTTPK